MNSSESPNTKNDKTEEWRTWTPAQTLSNFLHESRTPLIIIKGYTQILSNNEAKEHHPEAFESISKAVGRLEELWEGMADYLGYLMRNADNLNSE